MIEARRLLISALRTVGSAAMRLLYRAEISGLEHYAAAGPRALIVVNHTSYLDAPLLFCFLPEPPTFAINTHVAEHWWVRPWLKLVKVFRVDTTSPISTKAMISFIRQDRSCLIFPEGRLTQTGALMKIYEGPGVVADKANAPVLPIRIDGAQFTPFSRLRGKLRLRWFPRIALTVLPPVRLNIPESAKGRARRQLAGRQLYDIMSDMMYRTGNHDRSLFTALLDARDDHGGRTVAVEDAERPITYDRLIVGSLVLGRRLAALTERSEIVGLLLPNAVGAAVAFFALHAFGRPTAVLNFSAGETAVVSTCRTAKLRLVLTSRRFIERLRLEPLVQALSEVVTVRYLEDIRAQIGIGERLRGLLAKPFARTIHRRQQVDPGRLAVILYTSGTEGEPKGVALSHRNVIANCLQVAARVDFMPSDTLFNALPIFHSFGLTAGLVLPVIFGVRCFLYPSPLHYRIVPEMVYATNATILFGTDTFLAGYGRSAHAYDFYSVRYVFAGAEKLKPETRRLWAEKFGLRILEGYGTTEASPVISVNTPLHFRVGSVGRLLPDIEWRLQPVDGLAQGGVLQIKGPNVMLGYMRASAPGVIDPPPHGWYDTGDVLSIDAEGFATVLDRVKRFAKIGGEMVSLAVAEQLAQSLWPEAKHAVVTIADARKGEQLVLITDVAEATRDALVLRARRDRLGELVVPKRVIVVPQVPLLPSGKTDYLAVRDLVQRQLAPAGRQISAAE
jgi:acyl-[acyl-carrier-protein]-phospholipid O-acyltransferase/long-chain-fatty-acid--[acyl-carrier-protein] ligase